MTIRAGVIGCGYWGPNIIRNLTNAKGCDVVAVADIDPTRLDFIKNIYPSLKVTKSADEILDQEDIDAVAIMTPVQTHYELGRKALLARKHVLMSKPMTKTSREAEDLITIANESGVVLMVDHTFVYSGAVRFIQDFIQKGQLGRLFYFDSVRVNLGLFQSDVSVLWDLAPHDFSIIDFVIEEKLSNIHALGTDPLHLETGVESIVYVTADFETGAVAHLHLNWLSPVKIRRTLIGGSKTMIVYDHLDSDHQVRVYDKGLEVSEPEDVRRLLVSYRIGDMYAPKIDQTEALSLECQHFINCCLGKELPLTDGESGLRVVRMLEAAQQSLDLSRERK